MFAQYGYYILVFQYIYNQDSNKNLNYQC